LRLSAQTNPEMLEINAARAVTICEYNTIMDHLLKG
jgi:hypothetical protein